jgi:hypothetical protein
MKQMMILCHHWNLAKKDTAMAEGEGQHILRATRERNRYSNEDFEFALSLEMSEDKSHVTTTKDAPTRASGK